MSKEDLNMLSPEERKKPYDCQSESYYKFLILYLLFTVNRKVWYRHASTSSNTKWETTKIVLNGYQRKNDQDSNKWCKSMIKSFTLPNDWDIQKQSYLDDGDVIGELSIAHYQMNCFNITKIPSIL